MKSFHRLQYEPIKIKKYKEPSPCPSPCVYFLIDKNEIVYVGQSIALLSRIRDHKKK